MSGAGRVPLLRISFREAHDDEEKPRIVKGDGARATVL